MARLEKAVCDDVADVSVQGYGEKPGICLHEKIMLVVLLLAGGLGAYFLFV